MRRPVAPLGVVPVFDSPFCVDTMRSVSGAIMSIVVRRQGRGSKDRACPMQLIPDDELERLAAEHGPSSVEANAFDELRRERAQDKQVFAYRRGDFIAVGPEPAPEDEVVFMPANEATKHLKD